MTIKYDLKCKLQEKYLLHVNSIMFVYIHSELTFIGFLSFKMHSQGKVTKMEKLHYHHSVQDKIGTVAPPGMTATAVIPDGDAIDPSGPMPC
jgi:hypothetical protein